MSISVCPCVPVCMCSCCTANARRVRAGYWLGVVGYFQGIVLGSLPFSWRMHLYCVWMLRSMMMSGSMRPSVIVPTTMRPSPISSPRRNCIASRVAANLVLAVRGARRYVLLLLPVQWYIVRRYYAPIWSGYLFRVSSSLCACLRARSMCPAISTVGLAISSSAAIS